MNKTNTHSVGMGVCFRVSKVREGLTYIQQCLNRRMSKFKCVYSYGYSINQTPSFFWLN